MKKIILLAVIFVSASTFAKDIASISEVKFYGVDFSRANLFGMEESPEAVRMGLKRINNLFLAERNKYNVSERVKKKIAKHCFDATDENNEKMKVEFSSAPYVELSDERIGEALAGQSCGNDGTGLVIIAETLNKPDEKAIYRIVFFDENTKEIIHSKRVVGNVGGFGIRNYWAKSVLGALKNWKH